MVSLKFSSLLLWFWRKKIIFGLECLLLFRIMICGNSIQCLPLAQETKEIYRNI